jgi:hypothetical protein
MHTLRGLRLDLRLIDHGKAITQAAVVPLARHALDAMRAMRTVIRDRRRAIGSSSTGRGGGIEELVRLVSSIPQAADVTTVDAAVQVRATTVAVMSNQREAVTQTSRSRQSRSSTANMMRSRLFHQTRGAMLVIACHTGLVISQSADSR